MKLVHENLARILLASGIVVVCEGSLVAKEKSSIESERQYAVIAENVDDDGVGINHHNAACNSSCNGGCK